MFFEKIPCMAIYVLKMGGLERLPNDVGFVPNLRFNAKNLHFLCFYNPTYARRLKAVCTCIMAACIS